MGKKIAKKITDAKITHVSLVETPANNETFLMIKSNGDMTLNFGVSKENLIAKSTDEQLVYGIVYSPDSVDLQGEFADAETIKKMAHEFLADFRNIDQEHDFVSNVGTLVESTIALTDIPVGDKIVKSGSWYIVVKCNDEAWGKVKAGEFTGFSMAGIAKKKSVEVDIDEEGNIIKNSGIKNSIESVMKGLKDLFVKKDFNKEAENFENNQILFDYFDVLYYALSDAYYGTNSPEEAKAEIETSIQQFMTKINGLSFVYKNLPKGNEMENVEEIIKNIQIQIDELKASVQEIKTVSEESFEKSAEVIEEIAKKVADVEKSALNSKQVVTDVKEPVQKKKFSIV